MNSELRNIWMLFLLVCAFSCTKEKLADDSDKREVTILLDWSGKELPAGMQFRFYSAEEKAYLLEETETPAEGYSGALPPGRYRVLACNTGTTGLVFSGMEDYHAATATVASVETTRADGVQLIGQPSLLYAATQESDLEVFRREAMEISMAPRQLTRSLRLTLKLKDLPEVTGVEGMLKGLYSSVSLATGQPTQTAVAQASQTATTFSAEVRDGRSQANIAFFGILNPREGEVYRNEMPITLRKKNDQEETTVVDLTKVLTDLTSQGQGSLDFEIEDEIEISIEPSPAGLSARVVSWTRSGRGEGEITYIIY